MRRASSFVQCSHPLARRAGFIQGIDIDEALSVISTEEKAIRVVKAQVGVGVVKRDLIR